MSGTTRTAETMKTGNESGPGRGHSTSANGTGHAREAAHTVSETVAEAVDTATAMSSKVVDETREAMMIGVRTAAGVGSRVADISMGRSHHMLSSAARTMDIYHDASERSAERVQALFSSWMAIGRGFQQMQHAWLEMCDHALEHAAHKPQDLLQCKTMVEVAEVQRDLYIDAVDHALESSSRLLEMMNHTARDAVRPLQSRHQ